MGMSRQGRCTIGYGWDQRQREHPTMKTIKLRADVPEDRVLSLRLPDDVAAGPTEVVILVAAPLPT